MLCLSSFLCEIAEGGGRGGKEGRQGGAGETEGRRGRRKDGRAFGVYVHIMFDVYTLSLCFSVAMAPNVLLSFLRSSTSTAHTMTTLYHTHTHTQPYVR